MKKIMAVLLMTMMMVSFAYASEIEGEEWDDGWNYEGETSLEGDMEAAENFGFVADSDGYTGEWVSLENLNMQFCLPDGWEMALTEEEVAFYAETEDGKNSLSISVISDSEDDILVWSEQNLVQYEVDTANFYDVVLQRTDMQMDIYLINAENKLLAFRFDYDAENPITRELALEIVGTACDVWA